MDENLGRHVISERLRQVEGVKVVLCTDEFESGTPDTHWLPLVGDRILLTKDAAILRRPLELHALINAGVCAFFLAAGDLTGEALAEIVVKHLAAIRRMAKNYVRPCLFRINPSGVSPIKHELAPLIRKGGKRKP